MHRIALAAAALSLALAPAAFADDMASGSAPAQMNSAPAQTSTAPASVKKPHAIHYRSKSAAPLAVSDRSRSDMREQRETRAMNLIGAAGYNDFSDLKPDGANYRATAMKGGQRVSVLIDPKSGSVTPQ